MRPIDARVSGFLWLPTARQFPVTCRWTCANTGGGTYHHFATDYGTPTSSDIFAALGGEVIRVKDGLRPGQLVNDYQYGNHVRILHNNGYETRYAHLLSGTIVVHEGQRVEAGDLLGKSDNTGKSSGPHLHFEVRNPSGVRVNPYGDPPNYTTGCGPGALWATCPPTPAPLSPTSEPDGGYQYPNTDCYAIGRPRHPTPAQERCDYEDNDCDGEVDEPWHSGLSNNLWGSCIVGRGACTGYGAYHCAPDGRATVCSAVAGTPISEQCNGLDDDCDGATDEDWSTGSTAIGRPCTVAWGTCQSSGVWACAPDGQAVVCAASDPRIAETCDQIDNNCDGRIDNVDPDVLLSDTGHCGACGHECAYLERCDHGQCVNRCAYDPVHEYCAYVSCNMVGVAPRIENGHCGPLYEYCNAHNYRVCVDVYRPDPTLLVNMFGSYHWLHCLCLHGCVPVISGQCPDDW
ncbi:peptidoglycan DD-metalloendopeptidase family protein [Candidatus Uhrbacteria bacterium]|nr:peptidoglycan DD-metalloendopeptidase family protein [Candidatus Uhrbacteria bacterium]